MEDLHRLQSLNVLTRAAVQKELALSDEQASACEKLTSEIKTLVFKNLNVLTGDVYRSAENRQKFRPIVGQWEKKLAAILDARQFERLEQLTFQEQKGANVLLHPQIVSKLNLTHDQLNEIHEIVGAALKEAESISLWNRLRRGAEIAQNARTKAFAVLTDQQRERWTAILGPQPEQVE